jgi:glycosyltransferase involved in cell wall biosynthesis
MISVIVPAYNEEQCLPETLKRIGAALSNVNSPSEIIVVDNESLDGTRRIGESLGAKVYRESEHNISRVRNRGAEVSAGDVLIFVDADTLVPAALFQKIADVMKDEKCFGGAVSVAYEKFQKKWVKYYILGWRFWEAVFHTRQGAAQFCRREAFSELKGYDETIYIGEDVEFHWRLAKLAGLKRGHVSFIKEPQVLTSGRRFDKMSWWKTLLLTNPIFIALAWRKRRFWKDWYEKAVR